MYNGIYKNDDAFAMATHGAMKCLDEAIIKIERGCGINE